LGLKLCHLWGNSKCYIQLVSVPRCWCNDVDVLVQFGTDVIYNISLDRSDHIFSFKVQKSATALFCTIIILAHLVQKSLGSFLFYEISKYAVSVIEKVEFTYV
jgi:hypothetical protein